MACFRTVPYDHTVHTGSFVLYHIGSHRYGNMHSLSGWYRMYMYTQQGTLYNRLCHCLGLVKLQFEGNMD